MAVVDAPTRPTHDLPGVHFTSLATPSRGATTESSVWQVEIDPSAPATRHEVTREEVFVVLAGSARVRIADTEAEAGAGDAIVVAAGVPFEIAATGGQPMRALCVLPVGGQARMAGGGEPFTPPWAR
jgi:mannose-6-phosphate isomerase-like protein (cupin superfamily)